MAGFSPVILIYLNKHFEGVITDKKVEKDREQRHEFSCTIVVRNDELLFVSCQGSDLHCATAASENN